MQRAPFNIARCTLVIWFMAVAGFHPCRAKAALPQSASCARCHHRGDRPTPPSTPGCVHCGTAVPGVLADVQPFAASPDFAAPLFDARADLALLPPDRLTVDGPARDSTPPPSAAALSTCARLR